MPVELPPLQSDTSPPSPPRALIWAALLAVMMLAGVALMVLNWPEQPSARSARFWAQWLGLPLLAWAALFGLRLHAHDDACNRLAAEDAVRKAERESGIAFGSEPLAIVDAACWCGLGANGVAAAMAAGASRLEARCPHDGLPAVRHTRLPPCGETLAERYQDVFDRLLDQLAERVRTLPRTVPFEVQLHVPAASEPAAMVAWNAAWQSHGLPSAGEAPRRAREGLMALDAWLDKYGGPELEKVVLLVAVQLHEHPPQHSAEAAVALLAGWAPLLQRQAIGAMAMLHRPVQCEDGAPGPELAARVGAAVQTAAMWARTTPAEFGWVWHTGLGGNAVGALQQAVAPVGGPAQATNVTNIDAALGHPGTAAAWLGIALAVEHAAVTQAQQLVICGEDDICMAGIRPAATMRKTGMA